MSAMIARYGLEDPPLHHAQVNRRGAGARADAIVAGHSVPCAEFGADPHCHGPSLPAEDLRWDVDAYIAAARLEGAK